MAERTKTIENRILFPGNPWPNGHAFEEFVWSGRLTPDGFWFDFHLITEDYYEGDDEELDDEDADSDWEAKIVWSNYHHCILSSTYWGGDAKGIFVSNEKMIGLESLEGTTFDADPLPIDDWDEMFAFNVYLLGHDSVAEHVIKFVKKTAPFTYTIDWNGKVALTYAGHDEFEHTFELRKTEAKIDYITVQDFEGESDVTADLKRLIKEAEQFEYVAEESGPRFRLRV